MNRIRNVVLNAITVMLSSIFPAVFLYCQNAEEMKIAEVSIFGGISTAAFLAVYMVMLILVRNAPIAGVFTVIISVFCLNYSLFERGVNCLLPNARYWHIVPTVFVLIVFAFSQLIHSRKRQYIKDISTVLCVLMTTMTLMNLFPVIPVLLEKTNKQEIQSVEGVTGKPNIYWMTFDECANFEIIERYYKFNPSEFQNKLIDHPPPPSHQSDNVYDDTLTIMTNCMALESIVDLSTPDFEKEAIRMNSPLHQKLMEMQYSAVGIGDTSWLGFETVTDNNMTLTKTMGGETAVDLLIKQTIIAPFYHKPNSAYAQSIMNVFEYLNDVNNYQPDNSTFYVVYACTPHVPFLFDRNGMAVSRENFENWIEPQYYLGQYIYIMNRILESIDVIVKNDPNSIVILCSDHGPRSYPGMDTEDKSKNLLAVYNRGEIEAEITGKSTIDVLNQVLRILEKEEEGLEA